MPLKTDAGGVRFNARYDGNFNKPFTEQVNYFRQKLNVPTEHYDDILKSGHDRAFMVAGAMTADLLGDFRNAVDQAITNGEGLSAFRKRFDAIVAKHGWEYTGSRDWRSRVIYTTNMQASYAAGRYQQLTDPDLLQSRPYWRYVHNDTVRHPRPLHLKWGQIPVVLRHDDPWWQSHFPPNGWGCRCRIEAVRAKDYPGDPAPDDGERTVKDRYGNTHSVPKGIDYGWDYAPGAGLAGRNLSEQAMDAWRAMKADAWETLTAGNWASNQRPETIPLASSTTRMGKRLETVPEVIDEIKKALGGESKVYVVGGEFGYPVLINAEVLGEHIDPVRSPYVAYIDELMTDPYEVWAMFQRHKGTDKVEMRLRVIKRIETGSKEGLLLVAQAAKGRLEAWTFIPATNLKYLNKQREGLLVYAKE